MIDLLTLFVTLGLVSFVLVVHTQLDKRRHKLEKIRRYVDKTRQDLEGFVEERTREVSDLAVDLEAYQRSGIEILKKLQDFYDQIGQKASAVNSLEERMKDYESSVSQLNNLSSYVQENLSKIQSESGFVENVSKRLKQVQQQIEGLEGALTGIREDFAHQNREVLEEVEARVVHSASERARDLFDRIEAGKSFLQYYEHSVLNIDVKKEDLVQDLHNRIDGMIDTSLATAKTRLESYEKIMEDSYDSYHNKFQNLEALYSGKLESTLSEVGSLSDNILHQASLLIEKKAQAHGEQLEARFVEDLSDLEKRQMHRLDLLFGELQAKVATLESIQSDLLEDLQSRIAKQVEFSQQRIDVQVQNFSKKMEASSQLLDSRLSAITAITDDEKAYFQQQAKDHYELTNKELREKLADLSYSVKDEMEGLQFMMTKESKEMRDLVAEDKQGFSQWRDELKNDWQEIVGYVQGMEGEIKEALASQSQKGQAVGEELFNQLEDHFREKGLDLHKKWHARSLEVEQSAGAFLEKAQTLVADYQGRIDAFDANLSDKILTLENNFQELQTSSHGRFGLLMEGFEKTITDRLEDVRTGLDSETQKFEDWVISLESRLTAQISLTQNDINELEQEANGRMESLKNQFDREFNTWRSDLEQAQVQINERMQVANSEITQAQTDLDSKIGYFKDNWQNSGDILLNKLEELRNQSENYGRELFAEVAVNFDRKVKDLDTDLSSKFTQAVNQSSELVGSLNLIVSEKQREVDSFQGEWQTALDIMREKFESVQLDWGKTYENVISQGRQMGEELSAKLIYDLGESFKVSEAEILNRFVESQKASEGRIRDLEEVLTGINSQVGIFQEKLTGDMESWKSGLNENVRGWQHNFEAGQQEMATNQEALKANFQDLKGNWQNQFGNLEGDFNRRVRELDIFYKEQIEGLRKAIESRYGNVLEDSHAEAHRAREDMMEAIRKQEVELAGNLERVQEHLSSVTSTSASVSEEGEKIQQKLASEIMDLNSRIEAFSTDMHSKVTHIADTVRVDIVDDVDRKIEEFDKGIRYRFERLHSLEDEMVSLELNLKVAIEDLSGKISGEISQTMDSTQNRLGEINGEMSSLSNGLQTLKAEAYTNVSDHLKIFEDEFFQDIKARSERLDTTLSTWQASLEQAWETKLRERMGEINTNIDQQTADASEAYLNGLKEQIEKVRGQGRAYFDQLQAGFAEFEKEFQTRFEETRGQLESSQSQMAERQDQFEESQKQFREQILHSSEEGQAMLDNLMSTSREKMSQQVRFVEEKITNRLNDFTSVLDVKQKGMEDWLSTVKQDVRYWQEEVFTKIKEDTENLKVDNKSLSFRLQETATAFGDFKKDMESAIGNVNDRLNFQFEENSAELDKRMSQLRLRLENMSGNLEQDQDKLKAHFNQEMSLFGSEVEKLLNLRKDDIDKKLGHVVSDLEGRSQKLYDNFEKQYLTGLNQGHAFQEKLQKDLSSLSRDMDNIKGQLDDRVAQAKGAIDADFSDMGHNMREQLDTLKEEIKGRLGDSRAKMEDFDTTFEDYQQLIRSKLKDSYDALIGRVEEDWNALTAQIDEKAQSVETALSQKMAHIQGLEEDWEEKVKKNYQKLFAEIQNVRSFHKELDEIMPLGEKIRVLRQDFLSAVQGMEGDVASVNEQKQTIQAIMQETNEAKILSEQVVNSFDSVMKEKDGLFELKQETDRMSEVARDIEDRLERVMDNYKSLDDIQKKILHLAELDAKMDDRFGQYESQKQTLEHSMESLTKSHELAGELEGKVQNLFEELGKLPAEVQELKEHYQVLSSHETSAQNTIEMVERMGDLIGSLEERAEKTQGSLKWLGHAETRLEKMSREAQEQIRLLGLLVKDESRMIKKDQIPSESIRHNVMKLARQGWSKDEIARATKLSLGEVELITELGIMPVED